MSELKEILKRYQYAHRYSQKLPKLKAELIDTIKKENLTKNIFEINDTKITYHQYEDKEGITQKLIREVIQKSYPTLDGEEFIRRLCTARKLRKVETIKVTQTQDHPPHH
jgi:predicted transcriptional regulator